MVEDYRIYLAEKILGDQKVVTYRSLSRALKAHANTAKCMLEEFHRSENAKRKQSVNATYLVTGTPKASNKLANGGLQKDGEDTVMQSDSFMSSQASLPEGEAQPPVTVVLLVREEELLDAKEEFESILSIFIYSVGQTPLQDLNVLADIGHGILDPTSEDLLETGKQYGMIQNKNVKRRLGLPSIPQPRTTENAKPASSKATEIPKRTDTSRTAADDSLKSSQSGKESTKGERNAPKKDAGSIFSAFSKSKTKPKKEPINLAPSSKEEKSSLEQKPIFDTDSEEEQGEFFPPPNPKTDMDRQKGLKEREADLKDMMEKDDDEDMPDASESESEPEPEPEPENTVGIKPTEGPPRLEEVVDQAPAPPGRRRGKRQVMKKRTRKDEDGYLVTTEEPVWESFSEDEAPPPPKRKSATLANMKSAKLATKNQGSIMAFFGKK